MPLDNTDVASLGSLAPLTPLQATDLIPVYRPGSASPLNNASIAEVVALAPATGVTSIIAGAGLTGGTITSTGTIALAATAVSPGTYGDAAHVSQVTVNAEGQITGAASVAIMAGQVAIKDHATTRTSAAVSLNFAQGFAVSDASGAETITTIFASVKDYGAAGDGTTDDTTAFVNAAAAGLTLFIPPGTYKLTGAVTFPSEVIFLAGASLAVATTVLIAFNGGMRAPLAKVFALTGTAAISFDARFQRIAFAEWWGAVTYLASAYPVGSPTYSDAAIQAAINSGVSIVSLMGGDYYIAAALVMLNPCQTLEGVGTSQNGHAGATRLIITSATIDGIVIGPSSNPGGSTTALWLEHVTVKHLMIQRSTKPTSVQNTSGINGYVASPTGLRLRWCVACLIEDVLTQDHANGFYMTGSIFCRFVHCQAFRTLTANGSAWDYFIGYLQDNSPVISFLASGNASMYYEYSACFNNGAGTFMGVASGFQNFGGFSDTFIHGFESAELQYGIYAQGSGVSGSGATNEDLKITNCVVDACSVAGITVLNCNSDAQVIVTGNYCALSVSGAQGIHFRAFLGAATVANNQIMGAVSGATGIDLETDGTNSTNSVMSMGNVITDCTYGVIMNGAVLCRSEDVINNPNYSSTACVYLTGSSSRCIAKPIAAHGASAIKIDTGVGYCEVSPSGLNLGSNKILYNGSAVTAAGTFGTNNVAMPGIYA